MSETMTKSKLNEKVENVNILKEECAMMVKNLIQLEEEELILRLGNKILAREIINCGYRYDNNGSKTTKRRKK